MSSHAGTLVFKDFGVSLFGTPSAASGGGFDQEYLQENEDLESLRPKALDELEREYAYASVVQSPDVSPANQLSWLYARKLITALDVDDQPTDVYFDRKGNAILEWRPRRGVATSLVVGGDSILRFASSRFGTRQFGTAVFSDTIPEPVLIAIRAAVLI